MISWDPHRKQVCNSRLHVLSPCAKPNVFWHLPQSGIPLEDMLRQVAAFGVAKTAVPRAFRVATPRSFRLTVYSMKDISPTEAQSAVNDGATYLDVR